MRIAQHNLGVNSVSCDDISMLAALNDLRGPGRAHGPEKRIMDIPVRVEVDSVEPRALAANILVEIVQIMVIYHLPSMNHHSDSQANQVARFRIHELCIHRPRHLSMDYQALECMKRIVKLGVRVRDFPRIRFDAHSGGSPRSMLDALQVLFPSTCDVTALGITRLQLSDRSSSILPQVLLSAVQKCHTLREVELTIANRGDVMSIDDVARTARRQLFQWVAYALFSPAAQHQIKKLTVNAWLLEDADVDGIRDLLKATHPLKQLLLTTDTTDQADPSDPPPMKALKFYLKNPTRTTHPGQRPEDVDATDMWVSLNPVSVDTIHGCDGDEFWCVLLPGYGQAWVHRHDILDSNPSPSLGTKTTPTISTVPHIKFEFVTDENRLAVSSLLHLIGGGVTTLEVKVIHGDELLPNEWYQQAFSSCPKLRTLLLESTRTTSLQTIVDSSAAGDCKLRCLAGRFRVNGFLEQVLNFFQVLCDRDHPMTTHLQEIRFGAEITEDGDLAFIGNLIQMFQSNSHWRSFDLVIHGTETFPDIPDEIMDAFEPIFQKPDIRKPLATKSKLAFLSTTRPHQTRQVLPAALGDLDSSVVSIIFEFAAEKYGQSFSVGYDHF